MCAESTDLHVVLVLEVAFECELPVSGMVMSLFGAGGVSKGQGVVHEGRL